jgi:hypothetical protein
MMLIAYVGTVVFITLLAMGIAALIAKSNGKNPYRWAKFTFFALLVYMVWDIYPTYWAMDYYCKKEAGFWIYKTQDQWKAENPGVMERLVADKYAPSTRQGDRVNYTDTYVVNQRFNRINYYYSALPFLPVHHNESAVVDSKTAEVLARYVDFGSHHDFKFWLNVQHCNEGEENYSRFLLFKRKFQGVNK